MTIVKNSRVLITGAASGIGRSLALRLSESGGRLVLWDIDREGLDQAQAELAAAGYEAETYVCDLAHRHEIASVAAQTLADGGAVDILINNAGIVSGKSLLDLSDADIERTFEVNTLALFWTVRAFLPSMLEQDRGHVVTIASAASLAGAPKLTDYSASKFAALGFDESLRLELRQRDSKVTTTIVCPYYIDTGMFDGVKTRFSWLLPILKPEYVVGRIINAIEKNRRRLIMPRFMYTSWLTRLLPVAWYDVLMDFFGVTHSMDEFHGGGD